MRILAFTGLPGAGKSVAVEVAKEKGIPVVRMGEAVWEEVDRRGLPHNDANVGGVANEMRKAHGMAVWAERTAEKVLAVKAPLVVIDGVRNPEEMDCFRRRLGHDFRLVAIYANHDLRKRRLLSRGRTDDVASAEEFERREAREKAWGIEKAMEQAEIKVWNEGDIKEFLERVKAAFAR